MLTCGKFLLVEYRVEQEKWDRRFGLARNNQDIIWKMHELKE